MIELGCKITNDTEQLLNYRISKFNAKIQKNINTRLNVDLDNYKPSKDFTSCLNVLEQLEQIYDDIYKV